ncbi:MAG: C25 family cysteine peptidase, partial [Proteobacteria bacterium]|nr:C25 family cysteine peptidase [Pseudomonadota bacterium]
ADFTKVSDTLAKILPSNYAAEKVYLENYSDVTAATSDLVSKINAGSLATNYTGHGSVDNWAGEFLFHTPDDKDQVPRNDVDLLNNGQNLTFVITLDCLNGFFPNFLDKYSLAEELVRAENKGAIACFASTGLGFTSDHEVLAKNIFENLFNKGENIIGQLVTLSKIAAYTELQTRDIVETFVLLGDPATELKTSSVPSSIKLLNPGDAAVLHRTTRYTFTWDDTNNTDKYKIEFSADPDFPVNKIMRAPLIMSQFIAAREYTPNFFIWFILNIMGIQNEKLYWRVVSYGTGNEILEYSQTRSFSIKK